MRHPVTSSELLEIKEDIDHSITSSSHLMLHFSFLSKSFKRLTIGDLNYALLPFMDCTVLTKYHISRIIDLVN